MTMRSLNFVTSYGVVCPRPGRAGSAVSHRASAFTPSFCSRNRRLISRRGSCSASENTRMILGKSIVETLEAAGTFKSFLSAAKACGAVIGGTPGKQTVFAPSDAAFARMDPSIIRGLLEGDSGVLRKVLMHHVVPGVALTTPMIQGAGQWEGVEGGPLGYEGLGGVIKVGGSRVLLETANWECDDGIIHVLESVILPSWLKLTGELAPESPATVPVIGESSVTTYYGTPGLPTTRASDAASFPSTTGGRKAMGLMEQLPFWMYGPPFNAAYQEDYEPISIAQPDVAGVDYQLMPPGSVVVTPDSVNSGELNPVSGYSKYIGKTKKYIEGAGLSDYSKLDK